SERHDPRVYVLPPGWLRPPLEDSVSWLGSVGLKAAYVSGWCAFFDYTGRYGLDAQFPLSDHGDFEDVMTFIEACRPRKVYTAFSGAKDLAKAVERRLKIRAEALLPRSADGTMARSAAIYSARGRRWSTRSNSRGSIRSP